LIILCFSYISFDLYQTAQAAKIESEISRKKLVIEKQNLLVAMYKTDFQFFLLTWRSGRVKEAEYFSRILPLDSERGRGAQFLLDSRPMAKKETGFRDSLGAGCEAFAEFILGEGYFKEGNLLLAFDHFRKCQFQLGSGSDRWLKVQVRARLAELSSVRNGNSTSSRVNE